jgi:hypothetical protein
MRAGARSSFEARKMAGGRDLLPRSPRWLNALIWSSGVGAALLFLWSALFSDAEPSCVPLGFATVLARLLACIMLPAVLAVTLLARAVRWVSE